MAKYVCSGIKICKMTDCSGYQPHAFLGVCGNYKHRCIHLHGLEQKYGKDLLVNCQPVDSVIFTTINTYPFID